MGRHIEVVLDGETYKVPTLTVDQLERVMDILTDEAMQNHRRAFRVLPIMVEFAEPAIDPALVRCTSDEMTDAVKAIMKSAGVKTETVNPPVLALATTDAA